jgi:hypothetical protein
MPLAHLHALGQGFDGKILLQMRADPRDQLAQPVAGRILRLQ